MADKAERFYASSVLIGIFLASLADAIASSSFSMVRVDMMGDSHASPDEFAILDYGYTATKLLGFAVAAWLARSRQVSHALAVATIVMTAACAATAVAANLPVLVLSRLTQGGAGGILLVCGQTVLFQYFPKRNQAWVQVLFAVAAVVAPATIAPYLHGWVLDFYAWQLIFFAVLPLGLTASALLTLTTRRLPASPPLESFDAIGFLLIAVTAFAASFVFSQGNRWDWYHDQTVVACIVVACTALFLFVCISIGNKAHPSQLLNFDVFKNPGFSFGFLASFAAGFALTGSSFLIPSFAVSVLKMTPLMAGTLLLPSTAMFIATLCLAAVAIARFGLPPVVTVPFGILGLMCSMFMLSYSSSMSGVPDMLPAVLLRGAALGCLFLSITLITLLNLNSLVLSSGVALFNTGRLVGGIVGISFLQTFIEDQTAQNRAIIGAHVVPGRHVFAERISILIEHLSTHGMERGEATKAAALLIGKDVIHQATVIAFNSAFFSVAVFFLFAAPVLIFSKIIIGKIAVHSQQQSTSRS